MNSRRDVLRMGAGAATVGAVAALAGCSNAPVVGGYFAGELDYTEWAYDPATLGRDAQSPTLRDVATLLGTDEIENKGEIRNDVTNNYSGALLADDVDFQLTVGQAEILAGSFDPESVIEEKEFTPTEEYGEFDVYVDEDEGSETDALVATDGDVLVRSNPSRHHSFDAREEIELLIDTYTGDAERFVDINSDFERVHDELGTGAIVHASGRTASSVEDAPDDTIVAEGLVVAIDGAESSATFVLCYRDEAGVDLERIEDEFEAARETAEAELTDISQDGRFVTVEYAIPTSAI